MADLPHAQRSEDLPSTGPESNGVVSQPAESLESLLSDSGEDADEQPPARETRKTNRKRSGDRVLVPPSAVLKEMETIKIGYLDHSGRTFQRWSKKYLRVAGGRLFISKTPEDKLCEQIILKDAIVAENSTKNVNHSFTVLTPSQQVAFAGSSRKEMEAWMSAFRVAASKTPTLDIIQHLEGHHSWYSCSHSRPTYCNVCKEALHGMAWHGLSCEVCKIKSHRRCVFGVKEMCKWTTRSSLEQADVKIGYDYSIPHQWLEGNLPNSSKCAVCLRACGSVRRLQDFRCLWCKWTVHTECMDKVDKKCSLGDLHLSILPPSMLQRSDAIKKAMWEPYKMVGHSPVLALVNSKSGDNQGVRFLRKLKYWLNPVQIFDLAITGPDLGLQLFQRFEKFRIIVFGGDGSIGWVLSAVDKFNLHSKTMLGVVPLGTGNDMARVMGWGAQFGDEEKLPTVLREMECSSFHLLDRWSIQFCKGDVDMSPIMEATTPSVTGRPPASSHLDIPLPGPGSSPRSKDPVFSPSSSNSDSEYKSAVSQTPSPEPGGPVENPPGGSTNSSPVEYEHGDAVDEDGLEVCTLPIRTPETWELSLNSHTGVEQEPDVPGMVQDPVKLASFQHSVAAHLSTILISQDEAAVLSSAGVIYQVVSDFISSVLVDRKKKLTTSDYRDDPLVQQCTVLQQKLKGLLNTLKDEAKAATDHKEGEEKSGKIFRPRDMLMARANSLKKAMRSVIDMTEKEVDAQAQVTAEHSSLMQPVCEEPSQASPNLSPSSSQSSIDSGPPQRGRMSVSSQGSTTIGSVVDPVPVLRETEEVACMNNYFGIGVDAQIAYQFHTTREKNPAQYKSRTKNKVLYGLLAGKEFTANLHKNLDRKISLECDGKLVILPPRLQGLVFLNIPSYMAGTNFWGTDKEKKGFSAPSYDDKLMEVACITGLTQVATAKVLGIQNRRLAQCRYAKITLHEQLPVQVDGEAWLQAPGSIIISHKNKARMIFRNKTFSQSLESWKQKNPSAATGNAGFPLVSKPVGLLDFLTEEDIERYRTMAKSAMTLMELVKLEGAGNTDVSSTLVPLVASTSSSLERIFPDDEQVSVSETADMQHVQDFEREVKALVQETLWVLSVKKVSAGREQGMRECVRALEAHIRDIHSHDLLGSHEYRRASDTLLASKRPQDSPSAHRGRSALLVPDTTLTAASVAKKIGKEVEEWDTGEVCWWLGQLGLDGYDEKIHAHGITGKQLLSLQTSDFQDLGITKVGHLTKLRAGIQALSPSIHNSPTTMKRGKPTRETR